MKLRLLEARSIEKPDLICDGDGMSRNVWYSAGRALIATYARLLFKLDVSGHERIPAGGKLVIANHPSTNDPFCLTLLFPQPLDMLLTESAFHMPVFGAYLRRAGQVCVAAGDGRRAFEDAQRRLEAGRSVAIFPEGNVTPFDGRALTPRRGAARLALLTGMPVVPIGIALRRERIRHTRSSLGRRTLNGYWYLRGPYAMTVGEPVRFHSEASDDERVGEVLTAMMNRVAALSRESERRLRVA
jgi:1-acyl-sn-glycerol-3-phosphate acyltransferase